MVLIESSGRELSNSGHIVNFDYFDFIDENLDSEADFRAAGHFLTLFLAWSILKFGSNQAHYMPNR